MKRDYRILLEGVSRIYPDDSSNGDGGKTAVDRVSLRIGAGEHVGIIGANGAGKSTLLRMIAGLITPSCGKIEVTGKVTSVFTLGVGLREDVTGRENIYLDGELQGKRRHEIEGVLDEIIAFADLGQFIDLPLRTYSTGMKARLAFSMLIFLDPEILIIDEALSAGDQFFVTKAQSMMERICAKGKISLIVSHSMERIVEMCTRCIWLDGGKIMLDGSPEEVTRRYLDTVRRRDYAEEPGVVSFGEAAHSFRAGCEILQVGLTVGGVARGTTCLVGAPAEFRIVMHLDTPLVDPRLGFHIYRADGFPVLYVEETRFPVEAGQLPSGTIECTFVMDPVILGVGFYEGMVELLERETVLASAFIKWEVAADTQPRGGRPLVMVPTEFDVEPVR